jgi:hypothetical protein
VEYFVISNFRETKIPTIYMKVQLYFKFSKNKFRKKMKSPISLRNGRFSTSKCRGKPQKMGVLYTHSSKSPKQKNKIKIKIIGRIDGTGGLRRGWQPAVACQLIRLQHGPPLF